MQISKAIITAYTGQHPERSYQFGMELERNGGPAQVRAFLTYLKMFGWLSPEENRASWGLLTQVIANCDTDISLGCLRDLDVMNFDNGVYVIRNWEIVNIKYDGHIDQNYEPIRDLLFWIDKGQPDWLKRGKEIIEDWLAEHPDIEKNDPYRNAAKVLDFPCVENRKRNFFDMF